jgi:hypothetical protein
MSTKIKPDSRALVADIHVLLAIVVTNNGVDGRDPATPRLRRVEGLARRSFSEGGTSPAMTVCGVVPMFVT